MKLSALNQITSEVYLILSWGLGNSSQFNATPSAELAGRVYRATWVDTKTDGATYNVGVSIRKLAPELTQRQGVELVLECHRALRIRIGSFQDAGAVPQGLRMYVSLAFPGSGPADHAGPDRDTSPSAINTIPKAPLHLYDEYRHRGGGVLSF